MTTLIASNGERYRLVPEYYRSADEVPLEFLDRGDALQFLTELAEVEFNWEVIRRYVAEEMSLVDLHTVGEEELRERLAAALITEHVLIVHAGKEVERPSAKGSKSGEGSQQDEAGEDEAAPPVAPPPKDEKTWIKFEIVDDETGKPVKGVTLRVKLPDGQSKIGKSDAAGMIEFTDIPSGACEIEKMIDSDTLEVVSVG